MKASELRIDNLINVRLKSFKSSGFTKQLVTANAILDIFTNGKNSSFEFEPIPLTKEWLDKLGFESMKSDARNVTMYFISPFSIYSKDSNPNEFFISEGCIVKVVKYVHQLQNIYYYLKDKELTFK
jgi:hypothetical protein